MRVPRAIDIRPRLVRRFDPAAVTARSEHEVPAREAGLDPSAVNAIWDAVVAFYGTRLHPAIGICIRHGGRVILDRTIGHTRGNAPGDGPETPLVQATPDTLFNLFSASKVVTAMLIHMLDDEGVLHLDDAVCEYIPEFASHGKHRITLRHVLTHRAGIPAIPGDQVDLDLLVDRHRIVDLLCAAEPTSVAGRRLAYHAVTGGFVLGEIIERATGQDVRSLLAERILEPLGFDAMGYGVPPERVDEVAPHAFTGPLPRFPYSTFLERSLGVTLREAVTLSNDPRFLTGIVPSGNIIGTPNEACRFFELLLREGELDGHRVFSGRTVRRAVAEQSYLELDMTLMLPVRYGMGFMLGGDRLSFYGPGTPRAFGHLGFTNVLVYADPERELTVALLNNGKPFLTPRLLRWFKVMRVIAAQIPRRRRRR